MCVLVNIKEAFLSHLGVDLRRREAAMTKKFLDAPQVSAAIKEMGRETVT